MSEVRERPLITVRKSEEGYKEEAVYVTEVLDCFRGDASHIGWIRIYNTGDVEVELYDAPYKVKKPYYKGDSIKEAMAFIKEAYETIER